MSDKNPNDGIDDEGRRTAVVYLQDMLEVRTSERDVALATVDRLELEADGLRGEVIDKDDLIAELHSEIDGLERELRPQTEGGDASG